MGLHFGCFEGVLYACFLRVWREAEVPFQASLLIILKGYIYEALKKRSLETSLEDSILLICFGRIFYIY
jgi:hypothetical protein